MTITPAKQGFLKLASLKTYKVFMKKEIMIARKTEDTFNQLMLIARIS
jgi:hypothetical protein